MATTNVKRLLARIGGALAVVVAIFLGWLALNLVDEELTPVARELLAAPADPFRAADNLYLAIAGFNAPRGQSIIAAGEARIEAYHKRLDALGANGATATREIAPADVLNFDGDTKAWPPLTSSIWSTVAAHPEAVGTLIAANQELYGRYLALQALPGYFETARPGIFAPTVFVPPGVRALFLASVARRLQRGTPPERRAALKELGDDLNLWRAVLRGNGALLSKLLAVDALQGDLLLLGDLLTDPGGDWTLLDAAQPPLAAPFEVADWRIGDAFAAELRFTAAFLLTMPLANADVDVSGTKATGRWARGLNLVQVQFFKLHATENLLAEQMQRLRALADGDPGSYSKARDEYQRWAKRRLSLATPRSLYNPIGKILAAIAAPADAYPPRVYDVAALQRLVFLAYQIRRAGLAAEDVRAFMDQHPEWATHPIDAKPFRWEPASRTLTVITVGAQPEGRRFALVLPLRVRSR